MKYLLKKYLHAILDVSGPLMVHTCTSYLLTFLNLISINSKL